MNDINPHRPGLFAGVKNWRRYFRRYGAPTVKIKNPRKFLHAAARRRLQAREKVAA